MTSDNNPNRFDRRRILKATGALATGGLLAGCTGGDGGSTATETSGDGGSSGDGGDGGSTATETPGDGGDGESTEGSGDGSSSDWPSEPVQLVVPYGTSGGYNAYTRLTAKHMAEYLPVNVRVQNVTGASGRVATNQVYNAEPNGLTNQIVNVQSFVRQQILFQPDYDLTEMTWYPQIAANKRAIGVGTNTDIETWEQYVEATKAGELKFGATGPASGGSIIPLAVGEVSGLYGADKVVDNVVSFDGKGGTIKAIKSGDVQVMAGSISSVLPFVESGDVRFIIQTTAEERSEYAPDTPTLAEKDVSNAQEISDMITSRRVFAGPPGIPEENANILREAFTKAIQSDALQEEASGIDRPIMYADSETAAQAVQNSFTKWNELSDLLKEITGN